MKQSFTPLGPRSLARVASLFLALCGLCACGGGYPEPRTQLVDSEASLRAADTAGAESGPQSALHLKRAREQIASAKALIADGDFERADWTLKRAQVDADLALALAKEDSKKKEAEDAKEKLDELVKSAQKGK
jgi:hypothetical protein